MRVAILPTKFGYSAVALGPFDGTWQIGSAEPMPEDLLIQLRAQISHRLARYCWELSPWTGIWMIALLWAAWGGLSLGLSSLWDYGVRTALLYGWIRLLFFGNGMWLLCQAVSHWRGLRRARLIRNHLLDGDWEMDEGLYIPSHTQVVFPTPPDTLSEKGYVKFMMETWPALSPWYEQLLRVEKPLLFRYYPLGFFGFLRQMLVGPIIPVPPLCFEMGTLGA
jgi:hypothetical protein